MAKAVAKLWITYYGKLQHPANFPKQFSNYLQFLPFKFYMHLFETKWRYFNKVYLCLGAQTVNFRHILTINALQLQNFDPKKKFQQIITTNSSNLRS